VVAKVNAASVPRSERILGRATCLATDAVGDIVRIRAAKVGNVFQVEKVDIGTPGSPPAVAIIRKKDSPTNAIIHFHGPLRGIYAALSPGTIYLVGTDARPAKVGDANYPVGGVDYFQQIGVATSTDELLVIPLDVSFGGLPAGAVRFFNQFFNELPDGVRTSFTTAMPFRHGGVDAESVHYSGQRLLHGVGNDYIAVESGGVGTGWDTIVMAVPPKLWSVLLIDFVPDVP
jgi:hypothetical protein